MASDDYRWHYDYTRLAWDLGFTFQTHRAKPLLDKNLGHLDIERIIRDRDVGAIEKHIGTVIEFALDNDQTSILDPSFVKAFQISQLAVQYLLFCKRYLDNTVVLIKKEFLRNNEETKTLKRYVDELRQEAANSKRQIKELKSALNCQIASTQNAPVFQCNECPKAFSTEEYLLAHIKRRHETLGNIGTSSSSFQAETDKLQLEIKQLKERLNNTEKFIHTDEPRKPRSDFIVMPNFAVKDNTVENALLADLQQKFELLKTHVENELQILQTQKFDQEKYEKWFETFLNKLEQSHNASEDVTLGPAKISQPVCKNCQGKTDASEQKQCEEIKDVDTLITQDEIGKSDNTTQTDFVLTPEHGLCKDCQAKPIYKMPEVKSTDYQKRDSFSSNENIQQKVRLDTDHRLDKFEEKLQEKFTGSLEVLENQMQSFWNKMSEIEKHKTSTAESSPDKQLPKHKSNTSIDTIESKPQKVIPKPRQKVYSKEAFTSPSAGKPNQRLIRINTKPIEVKKRTTVTLPKNSSVEFTRGRKAATTYIDSDSNSDTESETSEDSKSSESGSETDGKPSERQPANVKPSLTSTLGQRSITSLKAAAFTPEVLEGLQKEVENILNDRLEELGVSPAWSTLPTRSYQRALAMVTHQAALIQKNISNYKHIRGQILKDLSKQASEHKKGGSVRRDSKLMNLLSNVKNKAKIIMSNESNYSNKPITNIVPPKAQKAQIQKPVVAQNIGTSQLNARMYATDSESDTNMKNRRSNAWNRSAITDQTQKAYDNVILELNTAVNTKIKQQELEPASETELKPPEAIRNDESEDESYADVKVETHAKGVLKNYPSTNSLQKKKVLFDLKSSDTSSPKQEEKPAVPSAINDGGSTTSIASSVFDGPKMNPTQKTTEKKQELSDVSDWDLSEILD